MSRRLASVDLFDQFLYSLECFDHLSGIFLVCRGTIWWKSVAVSFFSLAMGGALGLACD